MINSIDLLKYQLSNSLTGLNKCSCGSSSNSFDMVMISLLKAISTTNSQNINININLNKDDLDNILGLETLNSSQNSNKIEATNKDKNVNERIENAIGNAAKKYGVDENLIRSIIKVESNFDPNAVSGAGAKGLMQLMPFNCTDLGVKDPLNIEQNIDGGTRHIKEYLDMYNGDVQMALMAYNGGPGRMASRGVDSINDLYKMPKETQNYVPKVMKYYKG
ncbi:lytic transglycosylase domain-containing protein [Terrisporobacter vanillatitrophus]|uniref:lytic transglycosylase domain-containing protein n=1 Tax=Terrisporobacter vanillatitrophus TaxID=3058402 RepID=UPI0033664117